jgi:transcription initiation factor IIF auxiliary subunit
MDSKLLGGEDSSLKVVFEFGNLYREVKNPKMSQAGFPNKHSWAAFFRLQDNKDNRRLNESNVIEQVMFELDPTFNNPFQVKKTGPFEIAKVGWGSFSMPITVIFREETGIVDPLVLHHVLYFAEGGKTENLTLMISKDVLQKRSSSSSKA